MDQQLWEAKNDTDKLRSHLDDVDRVRTAAEAARDEAAARVMELEQSLLRRDERLREDAERCSLRLKQVKAVLTAYLSDGFETETVSDVVEGVRCLVQTLKDKSAVR